MKKSRIIGVLTAVLFTFITVSAHAALTMTYTGTYALEFGNDVLGLNGASFVWEGTFDENATRVGSNGGTGTLSYFESIGPITLTLSGTAGGVADGTYSAFINRLAEAAGRDEYILDYGVGTFDLSGASALWDDVNLSPGSLHVPNGFTGPSNGSNTLTPFVASDIIRYEEWSAFVFLADRTDANAHYSIVGGQSAAVVESVPVPAAAWLFGSGLIGLVGVARRKKA